MGIIAYLYQNEPNPFDANTSIKYKIDSNFQSARIIVSDFFGGIKAKYTITTTGEGQYLLNGSSLSAGTYYYSLIVNEVVVDTRIMFLKK